MTDWTRAERNEGGLWTVVDCRGCASREQNPAFNPTLMVCNHEAVRHSTDKPACIVARAPYGRCGPGAKYWAKKGGST